ncbi:Bifunctional (p)ppGpp synthase/hydrolase SpoT [Phocoenobacter uteri]|uniref:guanosine-3',5'-bis(diphosphate) 3'-diphosphatase n=1 Tax=Phocoenobacter uteri TaxID=146806 RepID=A0A379CD57_9PAST|nr:RelA/SpoT family protein [Phocoenobacter uteri]SUB59686.1 Bifunctional (p)ppGpp synthase/hydrolase SpoT [Phocoenobacter uteri]
MYLAEVFEELNQVVKTYLPADKVALIKKAFIVARDAHEGQFRSSGEPYICHPVAVAIIIAQMKLDHEAVMAALLHDVIEDTPYTEQELADEFGVSVAEIVQGVSKLDKLKFRTRQEAQVANFQKMVLAMTKDIRVVLIKLADRTHNMRTLGSLRPDKRRRIAKETLEIYTPLAHRLGLDNLKRELEDLCFEAQYPHRFQVLKTAVEHARENRKRLIETICNEIQELLDKANVQGYVYGREKNIYTLYQKMRQKDQHFQSILDIYSFRIVVDCIDSCYRTLGLLHSLYKPRPTLIKDYIAIPKPNGYQSLHTSMFGHKGMPIEAHIRTKDMEQMAVMGVAAHWSYKDEAHTSVQLRANKWLQSIVELQQSVENTEEFIENVKSDLFSDDIYVFTPKGRIIELPANSTAIDFAYALHSDIGHSCVAAIVDRNPYPLSKPLKTGQTVKIETEQGHLPDQEWLNFVVNAKTRSKIRHALKIQTEQQ